jgi:RNA polymerase sigma-70 factor (ECF subfamily)
MSDENDHARSTTTDPSAPTIATTIQAQFPFTSFTQLVEVQGDDETASRALATLCQNYWYPLYAFLRRRGHGEEDAKDLTQGFFQSFLSGKAFAGFDPSRGRLRSYLLGALKHFEANWKRHNQTIKAGGEFQFVSIEWLQAEKLYKAEPSDVDSPDRLFDRRWALTLLQSVHDALRDEYGKRGKEDLFEALYPFIDGSPPGTSQADAAAGLGMSGDAVKTALSRMRGRRRDLLRTQIAMTVASEKLVDEEIGYLLGLFEAKPGRAAP